MNSENLYKIRIYNDNRLTITIHDFNPFQKTGPLPSINHTPTPRAINRYMRTKDYVGLLKRTNKKLWYRSFDQERCSFITLTLSKDLDYIQLNNEFHRFLVYVKRKFGKFEYLKAIELQGETNRFHIHVIFQFQSKPAQINKMIIEKLWGLGVCNYEPTFDIRGNIQYVTILKDQNIQKENPTFTYFPMGAKVISTSQHFGTQIESGSYVEDYITADHLKFILEYHFKKFRDGGGKFVRVDEHKFYNYQKCEMDSCMDRVFIRTSEEFICSNFPDLLNSNNMPYN